MISWVPLLSIAICGVTANDAVKVDCAYMHVDVGGGYPWSEGGLGTNFGSPDANPDKRSGLLKVFVHNSGSTPVNVEAVELNGARLTTIKNGGDGEVIWWRTLPNPVPAKSHAEIAVRLRNPLTSDAVLMVRADKHMLTVTVPKQPPSYRIETVAWTDGGKSVFIVAQQLKPDPVRIARVFIDAEEVTARAKVFAPEFFHGVCPIMIQLDRPFATGSYHTYKLVSADGQAVACTLRTLDDFLRLGIYLAGDLRKNAELGINEATFFAQQTKQAYDRYAAYGQKLTCYSAGSPPPGLVGHPALYSHLLLDEPDVRDSSATSVPDHLQLGLNAMELIDDYRRCVIADPVKPVSLVVNMTYKPANYYVYGQLADSVWPNCYPLTVGSPLNSIREVTRAARNGAAPRRVETVVQVNWEDRGKMKYPRPPFAPEVWIQYLYALGEGARGFSGYEYINTENHHGVEEFPDVADAIGRMYRRIQTIGPLLLQAHPTDIAASKTDKVSVKTLLCGENALLLVVVNEDYESLPGDFVQQTKKNVELWVPSIPWMECYRADPFMNPLQAVQVDEGQFSRVDFSRENDGLRIMLSKLEVGEIILVTSDARIMEELAERYRAIESTAASSLLKGG